MAFLTIRIKDQKGHLFKDLQGGRVVIGRATSCEVSLAADAVSRQHCVLIAESGSWFVEDLGSANGTFVKDEKVTTRRLLNEGDRIRIGSARITFHAGERSQMPKAPLAVAAGDNDVPPENVPVRQRAADDPPEALPCQSCSTWFSIAHRMPGDTMACPRCGTRTVVPSLVAAS